MDAPISLRSARRKDAAAIARLCAQLGYPVSAAQVTQRLDALLQATDDNALFVLTAQATAIGWIHVLHARHIEVAAFAEIAALVIDEAHRNAHLGERLVDAAVEWAMAKGLATLRVRANVVRADAHRFYRRLGFEMEKTQAVLRRRLG